MRASVIGAQLSFTLTKVRSSCSGTPVLPSVMSSRMYVDAIAISLNSGYGPAVSSGVSTQLTLLPVAPLEDVATVVFEDPEPPLQPSSVAVAPNRPRAPRRETSSVYGASFFTMTRGSSKVKAR